MKKLIVMGRSESGKTTLLQALKGELLHYHKTQYINHFDRVIDTPGEYLQTHSLGAALALYAYEADIVGLIIGADEPFSLFPPNITCMVNREVIGIITRIDRPQANVEKVKRWLSISGCKKIFVLSACTGEGVADLVEYLSETQNIQRKTK